MLDSREEIAKVDKENVLGSIESFADQSVHAWEDASKIDVPKSYINPKNVVMCGMGGSGLGGRVVESVFAHDLKIPLTRINDYGLPNFVDKNSLVICSSYSGNTEETISNAKKAINREARWMAIGAGGKLIEHAQINGVPYYRIDPLHNPSQQPRMSIGYSVFGQLILASKAGVIKLEKSDLDEAVESMKNVVEKIKVEVPTEKNDAKKLANMMKDKIIIYFAANHLLGGVHTVGNQLNENAKALSFDYSIPELNHHLMEGLKHPESNAKCVLVILTNSSLYPKRIQERMAITKEVVEKNGIETYEYKCSSASFLSQAFEFIQFGAYANLYLSVLYNQNPAPIPWVDYFKKKLSKS